MKSACLVIPVGLVVALVAANSDQATPSHSKLILSKGVYTEGASFGDVDGDGVPDLLAGPLWFKGPKYDTQHRYRPGDATPAKGYKHSSFQSWVFDVNGDGRSDIFQIAHTGRFQLDLYLQPEKPSENWPVHRVAAEIGNESPEMGDLTGDGKLELIAMKDGKFGFFTPDVKAPEKPWKFHVISKVRTKSPYYHGLGFGDLNGDGRTDLLEKGGWYEGPKDPTSGKEWTFHDYKFSDPGGAQMLVFDIDGDGDNDIVTSLRAHSWGLAWYENTLIDGKVSLEKHIIIPEGDKPPAEGLGFSQAHALAAGDFNGDGITDFATGKRYWAHNGRDPGADGPAVIYWFETKRGKDGVEFIPHLLDSDSGVGTQLAVADFNKDGRTDLGVGNKKGVFIFESQK